MIALALFLALAPVRVGSKQFTESVLLGASARKSASAIIPHRSAAK